MNALFFFAAAKSGELELVYVWNEARPEAKIIIVCLAIFSIVAWSVMVRKAIQMSRAKKLNGFFTSEFRNQKHVLDLFDRRLQVDACPLFVVYAAGSLELDARLRSASGEGRKKSVSLKSIEHVKRLLENAVSQEALKLESGLILLAIAVSGGPFLGLLGTVWGVMETFADVAKAGSASLAAMAPGVSAALITTVTGLLVAIPAMFGYNFLVTTVRSMLVQADNFAAEFSSEIEHRFVEFGSRRGQS